MICYDLVENFRIDCLTRVPRPVEMADAILIRGEPMRGLIRASMMNPWAVTVFSLTIVLLGTISLYLIPIDILPTFKSPAVQVLTFYSGMPPKDVEMDITDRMERWTDMAAGLASQESRSILGASIVRNYFQPDTSEGEALSSVLSWSQSVISYLPPGTLPPVVMPFDPTTTTPACLVALNGEGLDEKTLYDIGRYEVRSRIMTIPGAVSPVVFGGKIRAVQVYMDRQKMQARNMSPLDVMKAVDVSNIFLPTGELIIGDMDYFLDSNSMFKEVGRMAEIPLRTEHGNRAFVGDVATPTDDAMIQTTIVRVDGRKQAYIPVMRQKGASTLRVIDDLKAMIPTIESELSKSLNLEVIMDQSVFVRQSISSLATEGMLGAGLCSLTILLFLGRWQMTGIAVMTIPLSVLSAMIFLYLAGQTINVMTLSGLSLAIGPMVDSAIICLENTDRYLEEGLPSDVSALKGASEVALPELVSSLCTLLVLMPLAVMPGMTSFLFGPLAMAVAAAMATAYILSRTLIPTCAAAWLKPKEINPDSEQAQRGLIGRAFDRWQRAIDRFIDGYGKMLDWVLDRRWPTVIFAYTTLLLVLLFLTPSLRREFFPQADAGSLEMYVRAPSGTRLRVTNERIAEVEQFLKQHILPERPQTDRLRDRRDPRLVVRLHPERRQDGHHRPHPVDRGTLPGLIPVCRPAPRGLRRREAVPRSRILVQRRRHDPRRHQRGQDRPHQHPRQGQGPENFAPDRRPDPPQGGQHRRRGRFPHHPAARLPRVHHRRRPGQGRRPGVNPGRRHEERHRRLQFEHSVQQDQLLDRRHQRQPVLRRRPVPAGKCRIDPNPARRAPHRRQPEQA